MNKLKTAWAAPWILLALPLYGLVCVLTAIAHLDHRVAYAVWKEMP